MVDFDHKEIDIAPMQGHPNHKVDSTPTNVGFDQGKVDTNLPQAIENHKLDKRFAWHMDYKVVVATADPATVRIDLVATRVVLVYIMFGFSTTRVDIATAMVVGKALAIQKVLIE